jgi:ribosomal protein S18 acetylase RimI-like enzyme
VARGLEVVAAPLDPLDGWLELSGGETDRARSELFAAEGFTPIRYYLEMRRPLADPVPEPALPPGLVLVPYDPARDEAVRLAHNEAFRDHWGSSPIDAETWRAWVTGHHDFRADRSLLVLDGDEVAGYALNSLHPLEWDALGFREGWTHQLGVRRRWRGRGVARALLAATMRGFAEEGLDFATLDVDAENPTGALALYRGVGYRRDRCRIAWARALPQAPVSSA